MNKIIFEREHLYEFGECDAVDEENGRCPKNVECEKEEVREENDQRCGRKYGENT